VVGAAPAWLITSDAASNTFNLPGSTSVTFRVIDPSGAPLAGFRVTFAEGPGEDLVQLGAAAATTDANGLAQVTVNSKATRGTAHVVATVGDATAVVTLPVLGAPVAVLPRAPSPTVLGLAGSGIQETGTVGFSVVDADGHPVPGVAVDFTQGQPALLVFAHASTVTDADGLAAAVVSSASPTVVGVTPVRATVTATGATAAGAVPVRGAKPSGLGLSFQCDRANLPTYASSAGHEITTCTARLADRYGNRIGVSTPVMFAAEAGTITAVGYTKAFDPAAPDSPDEGSVAVTYSSDLGGGLGPADVDPLPADPPGTFPYGARAAEPRNTVGALVQNPRDQLVTIIAMVQGEEGLWDTNLNGQLDPGEFFIDQGDPFIDANDDGAWGPAWPGGPSEVRFCASATNGACPAYQGPNGRWDSQRLLWVPTWVVLTGDPVLTTTPAGGAAPAADFSPSCLVGPIDGAAATAPVYAYDEWLNAPAAGGAWDAPTIVAASGTAARLSVSGAGFLPTADDLGSIGLEYRLVNAAGTGPCVAGGLGGSGTDCSRKLFFSGFGSGQAGTVHLVAAGSTGASCTVPGNVETQVVFTGVRGTRTGGIQIGSVAP
jgi:hypothetical protein